MRSPGDALIQPPARVRRIWAESDLFLWCGLINAGTYILDRNYIYLKSLPQISGFAC